MKESISHRFGQKVCDNAEIMFKDDCSQHGRKKESWEVMMEVQDPPHGPKRDIMETPTDEEPNTCVHDLVALKIVIIFF